MRKLKITVLALSMLFMLVPAVAIQAKNEQACYVHCHCHKQHKHKKSHNHKHKKHKNCKKCKVVVVAPAKAPAKTGCVNNCGTIGYTYQYPPQPRYIVANSPGFAPNTGFVSFNPFAPNGANFLPSNPFPIERNYGVAYYQNGAPADYYSGYQN